MRVFVTGATGFIGSAVVQELLGAGHEVVGLARSDAAAKALLATGARVHRGSIEDPESLRTGAAAADGVIHTAFFHGITHMGLGTRLRVMLGGSPSGIVMRFLETALRTDRQALEVMGRALAGPDRPLVAAFGTLAMTAGQLATEDEAADPQAVGGPRGGSEAVMQALATAGVRTSVIRLPPIVHGKGDRAGFAPRLIEIARKRRESGYVGDGLNRWPAVHVLDAARLFRLALENGTAGARYHGVAEEGVPFRQVADLIGARLAVPVASKTEQQAAKQFSFLASFLPTDNPTSSALTQTRLDWRPTGPGLLADLDAMYF
jgi:nucleoside-diphosphate-sugar epimerase